MLNIEPSHNTTKVVHVCVAVIERHNSVSNNKQVLIAKRPNHVHQGGLWEFPGGKVEVGEDVFSALSRELFEELDIHINALGKGTREALENKKLIQIRHRYPDKTVFLDVWRIQDFSREPYGKEGQEVRWVDAQDLNLYTFPAANKAIINACVLPNRYFITPAYTSILDAEEGLKLALSQQAELIYFRQPHLDLESYMSWVDTLLIDTPILAEKLVYQFSEVIEQYPGAGVHLSQKLTVGLKSRPISKDYWFSVSCHNLQEIEQSIALEADFITLSPLLPTKTHPGHQSIGWGEFKRLLLSVELPVYGLGGLSSSDEMALIEAGAQGLAGITFWQ